MGFFFLPDNSFANLLTEAQSNYKFGYYDQAWKQALSLANQNDPEAQFLVGRMLYNGKGMPRNYTNAREWFTKAAKKKHPGALNNLGVLCRRGLGGKKNLIEAAKWFLLAEALGNNNSIDNLFEIQSELSDEEFMLAQDKATDFAARYFFADNINPSGGKPSYQQGYDEFNPVNKTRPESMQQPPQKAKNPETTILPNPIEIAASMISTVSTFVDGIFKEELPGDSNLEQEKQRSGYSVQLFAFRLESSARDFLQDIEVSALGDEPIFVMKLQNPDASVLHRIRLGPYKTRDEAETIKQQADSTFSIKSMIINMAGN